MSGPKHPEVVVQLSGEDGNAFAIVTRVARALQRAGWSEDVPAFRKEAFAGDYDHLLATAMRWVSVE